MINSMVMRTVVCSVLLALLAGCAGRQAFLAGEELASEGKYDQAVIKYFQAVTENPESYEYKLKLRGARTKATWEHLARGRMLVAQEKYAEAMAEFQQASALDPSVEEVRQELQRVQDRLEAVDLIRKAEGFLRVGRLTDAKEKLDRALLLNPGNRRALDLQEEVRKGRRTVLEGFELDVTSEKPITLKFEKAKIRDVFDILSRLSGINFILDKDMRSDNVTVMLEDASFSQALELLLKMHELDMKVLNPKTILVFAKTKDKEKQFEDQIIQTFYLSNIDAKKAVNMLRTMLQLRKIYVHEELNALVIRDKPDVIKLAQQILEASDRADSEVIFDLEVVEVNHVDNLNVGARLSPYQVSFGLAEDGATELVGFTDSFSNLDFLYTVPSATFDFQKSLTDSEILANPKIRVKNKDKAKVHVGTREPVITVTTTGDTSTDNIQYVDVGVKLDVEPTIQLDNTVVTKVSLEVSNVAARTQTTNGSVALTISTTNAQTALSLKDGEQTVIGGLIRDDISKSKNTFPFIGKLPIIGDLLSGHKNDRTKREILLSITPHIVKNVELPRADVASLWSGLEDDLQAGPSFGSFAAAFEPETQMEPPATAPSIQKRPEPEASSEGPKVYLQGESQAQVGQEYALTAVVEGVDNLFSAPLFVTYDSEVLEFVRAEEGAFLQQEGRPTVFTSSVDPKQGRLIIGYKRAEGEDGASGGGNLFRLVFRAKTAGKTELGLAGINFQDPAGNRVPVRPAGITVEVR